MRIKKGDKVRVITGKYKGTEGVVKTSFPKKNKVIVENVNIATKHRKPTQDRPDGGIEKIEMPIDVSNVMLIDPKSKGKLTRIKYVVENNKKQRFTKKSNTKI